jgi:hypothetical protein
MGKNFLNHSLGKVHSRMLLTKAGKATNAALLNDEALLPPLIQTLRNNAPSPSVNSSLDIIRSPHSFDGGYHSEGDEPLPHINYISGEIERPGKMLTFDEYCKLKDIILTEGPNKEKLIRKIRQAKAILDKFEREIAGLTLFYELNPGVDWNGDKTVLLNLKRFPK